MRAGMEIGGDIGRATGALDTALDLKTGKDLLSPGHYDESRTYDARQHGREVTTSSES